ncbi:MAG TPA: tRNA (guanosine(37)-N1)-methyltransferase TrmD [Thermomicrobiales bacterium]|nr:tRNA (guanosine(37)-N1)-methyltransferase TrmD [Thermomicrobiales bacterium]
MTPPDDQRQQNEQSTPLLRFDLFTLFPGMFQGPLDESIIKRARQRALIDIALHDIRDWATDRHRTVDDTPYGGGAGMVMMAPPVVSAVESVLGDTLGTPGTRVIILSAAGRLLDQSLAQDLSRSRRLALICGHYEGIDERAVELLRAEEISIGDYVLTGGELAAMVLLDAVARLVPGVIAEESISDESHSESLVEYPHFTRPFDFRGRQPPDVLLSGHHANIARWRREQAIRRTAQRRPDLLPHAQLNDEERQIAERAIQTAEGSDEPAPPGPAGTSTGRCN